MQRECTAVQPVCVCDALAQGSMHSGAADAAAVELHAAVCSQLPCQAYSRVLWPQPEPDNLRLQHQHINNTANSSTADAAAACLPQSTASQALAALPGSPSA